MAYSISPYNYLRRYRDGVPVKLGKRHDEIVLFIEIYKYRNNSMNNIAEFGCKGWQGRRGAVRKAAKAAIKAVGGNAEGDRVAIPPSCGDLYDAFADHTYDEKKVSRTYTGKGSPEEIAEVLSAAVALDVIHPDDLWDHADKYIGLDCNGYVGNWAKHNRVKLGGFGVGANTSLRDYAAKNQDKKRTSVGDLRQGDVLVWVTNPHIALVEMVVDDGMGTFIVCESAKSLGGLYVSFYEWKRRTQKVEEFTDVNRLLGKDMRKSMKFDMSDGDADLKAKPPDDGSVPPWGEGDPPEIGDWISAAQAYGKANLVERKEKGTNQWVSAHGLTNV